MMFRTQRDDEARIFQAQLAALLAKGESLEEAVMRIELKADPGLAAMVLAARHGGHLLDGLVREGLLGADLAEVGVRHFREHLAREAEAAIVQQQVKRHVGRVFWFLGLMTSFSLFIYSYYLTFVIPRLFELNQTPDMPHSAVAAMVAPLAMGVMLVFLLFLGSIFMAVRLESSRQWRQFGFLWKIPGAAGFFRKQVTWRVLTQLEFLLGGGMEAADAIETALRPYGLKPHVRDGVAVLPETPLLHPASLRAVNLGASLDTLPTQLAGEAAALRADLPFAAQTVARTIFYAGYLVLGVLVGSMLVQMYEPLFSVANLI